MFIKRVDVKSIYTRIKILYVYRTYVYALTLYTRQNSKGFEVHLFLSRFSFGFVSCSTYFLIYSPRKHTLPHYFSSLWNKISYFMKIKIIIII